jgi:DNA-binding response OmpR family regulator
MNERVLIIEDDRDPGRSLEEALFERGFPYHRSVTAQEAIEIMKLIRFRLAFVDMALPDMKGRELAERLRLMDPELNIVVMTRAEAVDGDDSALHLDRGLFDACIFKPCHRRAIHDAVDELME